MTFGVGIVVEAVQICYFQNCGDSLFSWDITSRKLMGLVHDVTHLHVQSFPLLVSKFCKCIRQEPHQFDLFVGMRCFKPLQIGGR